ncbi:hypothetical protein [Ochrovirga pacifica]|uniref:hypothetical protein n=1 Tax=Ochrovirga pacifica TaxID=1042376 RepID=UPI0002559D61|nr:hypothetical protein [Ochrovirga pacifica]
MKHIIWIVLLSVQFAFSQSYSVEKLPSRIRLSGESIRMFGNEPDMGFLGIGYEVFGLVAKVPDWYFGVNTYSALTGIRSGFFVFGVSTGIKKPLLSNKLYYDAGLYLGGGGGSAAPDGGGFMVRPHLDIEWMISPRLGLRAGIAGVEFPDGGNITSLHANVGVSIGVDTYLTKSIAEIQATTQATDFYKLQAAMLSTTLFDYRKGPTLSSDPNTAEAISLIGFELNRFLTQHLYATVELGGAYRGGVDGFMMYLSGLGYELSFLNNHLVLDTRALIGGAGGGAVEFGGGLALQAEIGLGLRIKDYLLKANLGKTFAPNGAFESSQLDISLGRSFEFYQQKEPKKETVVTANNLVKEGFEFAVFNRTYFTKGEPDKQNRPYDKAFNLIGFDIEKHMNAHLSLLASTVWAYQGNYGAYAEGWLGLQYYLPITQTVKVPLKGMIGAGGGGDINLGNGLGYQYGIGLEKQVNQRVALFANLGQLRPVQEGNFTPYILDVGIKLNISQLVKR